MLFCVKHKWFYLKQNKKKKKQPVKADLTINSVLLFYGRFCCMLIKNSSEFLLVSSDQRLNIEDWNELKDLKKLMGYFLRFSLYFVHRTV